VLRSTAPASGTSSMMCFSHILKSILDVEKRRISFHLPAESHPNKKSSVVLTLTDISPTLALFSAILAFQMSDSTNSTVFTDEEHELLRYYYMFIKWRWLCLRFVWIRFGVWLNRGFG